MSKNFFLTSFKFKFAICIHQKNNQKCQSKKTQISLSPPSTRSIRRLTFFYRWCRYLKCISRFQFTEILPSRAVSLTLRNVNENIFFFWWPKILFFYLRFAFYTKRSHVEKTTDKRMRRTWKGKVGMIDFAIPRPVRTYRGRGWVDEESGNFHPLRLNIPIMNFEIDQLFKALPSINASVSFSIWF